MLDEPPGAVVVGPEGVVVVCVGGGVELATPGKHLREKDSHQQSDENSSLLTGSSRGWNTCTHFLRRLDGSWSVKPISRNSTWLEAYR